jgi:hypothetical protein
VIAHRRGVLERVQLLLEDWQLTRIRLADTERRGTDDGPGAGQALDANRLTLM